MKPNIEEILILLGIIISGSIIYLLATYPSWATQTVQPQYENSTPSTFRESWEQWQRNIQKWKEAMEENARRTQVLLDWQRRLYLTMEINLILCGLAIILIAYRLKKSS